jgi:hypothetical protein
MKMLLCSGILHRAQERKLDIFVTIVETRRIGNLKGQIVAIVLHKLMISLPKNLAFADVLQLWTFS